MPNVEEEREFLPELCHLRGPTQLILLERVVFLWRRQKPCFGVAKRQALISCAYTLWPAYGRAIWHHPPRLMQSCHGSNWLYGARSLGRAGKGGPLNLNLASNFLPRKFCVSAEKSVTVVLILLKYLPKVLLCLTASSPIPKIRCFFLPFTSSAEGSDGSEVWECTWGWGSTVPNSAAALHPHSDTDISGTLCYMGVSSVGEDDGLPRPFCRGKPMYGTWGRGWGVSQQLPCSHLGKQLRDAGALHSSTCSLQCL